MLPFAALADPVRRAIVERLAEGDVGAGQIAEAFPISRPAVSRHLRVLREAGLVTSRVAGQERVYGLDRRPLTALDAWLERFRPPAEGDLEAPRAPAGPAGRLDALDTEIRRGRRRRHSGEDENAANEGDTMAAPPAEIRTDDDGTRMVWRREYPDPVEDVWAAITESDRLGRWIGTWTGEPRVGGTVAFTMTGEVDAGGEVDEPVDVAILACDPPHRLVVELPEPGAARPWHVELTVEPHGAGAVLVFAQSLPDGQRRPDVEAGWRWYLDGLTASLRGTPMPRWEDYVPD